MKKFPARRISTTTLRSPLDRCRGGSRHLQCTLFRHESTIAGQYRITTRLSGPARRPHTVSRTKNLVGRERCAESRENFGQNFIEKGDAPPPGKKRGKPSGKASFQGEDSLLSKRPASAKGSIGFFDRRFFFVASLISRRAADVARRGALARASMAVRRGPSASSGGSRKQWIRH